MRPATAAPDASVAELRQIPVHKIDRNEENPRLVFRQEDLEQLLESIRIYGVQVPISVYKSGSRYVLIDGERRWLCCTKLNMEEIPALVQPKPTPLNNLLMMFNIHGLREQWDFLTIAMKLPRIIELMEEDGVRVSDRKLAERTGLPLSKIQKSRFLLDLPDDYKEMLLDELRKPKSQQVLSEDFFIEMERGLKTVARRMPDVIPDKEEVRRVLIDKYQKNTIGNVVDLRYIGKIAGAKNVQVEEGVAREALSKLFSKNSYSAESAYEDSVAEAYREADLEKRIAAVTARLQSLEPDELDDALRAHLQELRAAINALLDDERTG